MEQIRVLTVKGESGGDFREKILPVPWRSARRSDSGLALPTLVGSFRAWLHTHTLVGAEFGAHCDHRHAISGVLFPADPEL